VEPGGRRLVDLGPAGVVDVVDAAPVGAGVVAGDRAANVLAGERYALAGAVSIWNDGPGTLVLKVARAG
jgi:hypothetical protein